MIAQGIPGIYDFDGRRIFRPGKKRYPWFEGRPMGSFLSQPLQVKCRDIDEIRAFLSTCRYVSDQEQFGVKDHWMPPEAFEQARRGDCDDFALWTWRQLLALGYDVRYVVGRAGPYGSGHAWVSLRMQDRVYVVEPQLARYHEFPRLDTLRYRPSISVEASAHEVRFFEHNKAPSPVTFRAAAPLVPEWIFFRLLLPPRLLLLPLRLIKNRAALFYKRSKLSRQ